MSVFTFRFIFQDLHKRLIAVKSLIFLLGVFAETFLIS